MLFGELKRTDFLTNSPTFIPKDLYVEASVVVATNNRLSRFVLALHHASGPWCGDEGMETSIDCDVCVLGWILTSENVEILAVPYFDQGGNI